MTGAGTPDRKALPRELGEFLIEFAIALNRSAMYPHGHPSLERSAAALVRRLVLLLDDRATLSVGVARQQLVIEGMATDATNPVLHSLAARLHRQGIGAVVFQRGVRAEEVGGVLGLVSAEDSADGEEPRAVPAGEGPWPHVRLYPLAYENLELLEEREGEEDRERARSAQLWIGLARAALASQADGVEASGAAEPAEVARAINEHGAAVAYDQVIVGYMLQIAEELRLEGSAGGTALSRRMSKLVSELSDDVLARLVEMGGDAAQRRRFMLDAADGLAAGAVVELVQAAGSAANQTISNSMLRLLSKLSTLAEADSPRVSTEADQALREQVRSLVRGWQLPDPNPTQYTSALSAMAAPAPIDGGGSDSRPAEPLRIIQMAIELNAVPARLAGVLDGVIEAGHIRLLLDLAERSPLANGAADMIWIRLTEPGSLDRIVRSGASGLDVLDRVLARAPADAVAGPLLDALADAQVRSDRLALLERAGTIAPAIGRELVARLADERWYVRRNILCLLQRADSPPDGAAVFQHARDPHPAVRREALRLAVQIPSERERGIALALTDPDPDTVRIALHAGRSGLPAAATPLATGRLADETLPADVRVALVEVLGRTRSPLVPEALIRLVAPRTTLFGRPRIAARSAAVTAALAALAAGWSTDRRVEAILERARRSRDPEIRRAASAT